MEIWTKKENEIRQLDNLLNYTGENCKDCNWCNWEKGQRFFTCGYHLDNFTPQSWCSYFTPKNDPKLLAYFERKKQQLKPNTFKCKGCGHVLPKPFVLKTEGYCYLCDPNVTINELLK